MQNPGTAFRSLSQPRTPLQRFTSVAVVAGIHVAAITALIVGLKAGIANFVTPPIITRYIPANPTKPADPPKLAPIVFSNPAKAFVPVPVIDIGPGETSITDVSPTGSKQTVIASTAVAGIMATHSIPPYPPISRRLGHEGVVLLKLMISPEGNITAVAIETSSGYADLDDMAANWVKAHWRYRPALVAGVPVASMAEASVRFSLKDAR
jgi:protein TonB